MIVTTPEDFLTEWRSGRYAPVAPATPRAAFLVAPLGFALAEESARDNVYMANNASRADSAVQPRVDAGRALAQHTLLASALRESVPTIVFPGDAATPDAVFPNNVFATAPGRLIVGAMRHAVRKREAARGDIRAFFAAVLGYATIDLSTQSFVAELTGTLVIDRARGIGYCGLSERCDLAGARAMHEAFGLKLTFAFELAPGEYHANVVLAQLAGRALLIAPDGFADRAAAEAIAEVYAPRVLWLTPAQKVAYAGNAITLDEGCIWLSARAAVALTAAQHAALTQWGFAVRSVELDEIEKAGGSLRCCIGEIF